MAYVYRGTIRDVNPILHVAPQPAPAVKPRPAPLQDVTKCGTPYGYKLHQQHGTEPCDPCRDANTAYGREYRAGKRRRTKGVFDPSACGTHRGFMRHLRYSVELCTPCRVAKADYQAAYRAARKAAA